MQASDSPDQAHVDNASYVLATVQLAQRYYAASKLHEGVVVYNLPIRTTMQSFELIYRAKQILNLVPVSETDFVQPCYMIL